MSCFEARGAWNRLAGRIAGRPASRRLIPWFARHYGVEWEAAVVPAEGFGSLQEFFCRALQPGARPADPDAAVWVSPVDGRVGACGGIAGDRLIQAKGHEYSLAALVADAGLAGRYRGGQFCTLYLAPGDYHRVHAPATGELRRAVRIAGRFHPVNPRAVHRIPGLFAGNERLVLEMGAPGGEMVLVLVGACLVGGIRLNHTPPVALQRGQELGRFEFGSTVVVLAPPGAPVRLARGQGERVRVGEALMRPVAGAARPAGGPPAGH